MELDPDQVATALLAALEQGGVRRLAIDSIAELERALAESSGAERVPNYLAALLAALRERGITLLAIRETSKVVATEVDFSAEALAVLAENVLFLQQVAYEGRLRRVLSVLKMRFSAHDASLREFVIVSPEGLRVLATAESGEALRGLTGIAGQPLWPPPGQSNQQDPGQQL